MLTVFRLFVLAALVAGAQARACDKITRTTTFLGWTADSRMFAWRVQETCVGCTPKWVTEFTYVRTTGGNTTEYLTRYEKMAYPRPDVPDGKAWDAWVKRFPLVLAPPKNAQALLTMTQAGASIAAKGGEFCTKKEGPVKLVASASSREWDAPPAGCGCARGFVSPDGASVAWITGPAKRTCDDCHSAPCCGEVEGLLVTQGS
jgi:hypothetical protein